MQNDGFGQRPEEAGDDAMKSFFLIVIFSRFASFGDVQSIEFKSINDCLKAKSIIQRDFNQWHSDNGAHMTSFCIKNESEKMIEIKKFNIE